MFKIYDFYRVINGTNNRKSQDGKWTFNYEEILDWKNFIRNHRYGSKNIRTNLIVKGNSDCCKMHSIAEIQYVLIKFAEFICKCHADDAANEFLINYDNAEFESGEKKYYYCDHKILRFFGRQGSAIPECYEPKSN